MPAQEVLRGLPVVFRALDHPNPQVKFVASAALFAVASRPDGARLLAGRVEAIGRDLLTVQDEHLQNGEIIILSTIRPTPPQVPSLLLKFLKQPDRSDGAKAGAIFELIRIAPQNPEVTSETLRFLARPLDRNVRVATLNAVGNSSVTDQRLISAVIAYMDDSDESVRSTAIQATARMGKKAVGQAEPTLRRLANDPNQPAEITAQAKRALRLIGD